GAFLRAVRPLLSAPAPDLHRRLLVRASGARRGRIPHRPAGRLTSIARRREARLAPASRPRLGDDGQTRRRPCAGRESWVNALGVGPAPGSEASARRPQTFHAHMTRPNYSSTRERLECGGLPPLSIAARDRKLCAKLLNDFQSGEGRVTSSEDAGFGMRVCDYIAGPLLGSLIGRRAQLLEIIA